MKEGFFESEQQVHIIDDNKYRAAVWVKWRFFFFFFYFFSFVFFCKTRVGFSSASYSLNDYLSQSSSLTLWWWGWGDSWCKLHRWLVILSFHVAQAENMLHPYWCNLTYCRVNVEIDLFVMLSVATDLTVFAPSSNSASSLERLILSQDRKKRQTAWWFFYEGHRVSCNISLCVSVHLWTTGKRWQMWHDFQCVSQCEKGSYSEHTVKAAWQ